jgi:hypothetical protein
MPPMVSGLPAATSMEWLDILDDDRHVTGFNIIGGEHRLRNYRSVTSMYEVERTRLEDLNRCFRVLPVLSFRVYNT